MATTEPMYNLQNNDKLLEVGTFNLVDFIATKAAKLLWGKGYLLNSENELGKDRIDEILKDNNIIALGWENEYLLSSRLTGDVINVINVKDNVISIHDVNMSISRVGTDGVGRVIAAEVYRKIIWDDKQHIVRETYSSTTCKRSMVSITGQTVQIGSFNQQVPEFLQLEAEWDYTEFNKETGFIPVMLFKNKPSRGRHSIGDATEYRDIQLLVNQIDIAMYKDLVMNKTFAIGNMDDGEIENLRNKPLSRYIDDLVISLGTTKTDEQVPKFDVHVANPQSTVYNEAKQNAIDLYTLAAGYSPLQDSVAAQTVQATLFTKTGDVETTLGKQTQRNAEWNTFIKIIAGIDALYGQGNVYSDDKPITIEIKENIILNQGEILTKLEMGDRLGILTDEYAISQFYGTDNPDKIEAKLKELEEQDERAINLIQDRATAGAIPQSEEEVIDNTEEEVITDGE